MSLLLDRSVLYKIFRHYYRSMLMLLLPLLQILADSDTSLMLSLKHPLPAVRNMAVEHLKEVLRKGQVCYLREPPICYSEGLCNPSADYNIYTIRSTAT